MYSAYKDIPIIFRSIRSRFLGHIPSGPTDRKLSSFQRIRISFNTLTAATTWTLSLQILVPRWCLFRRSWGDDAWYYLISYHIMFDVIIYLSYKEKLLYCIIFMFCYIWYYSILCYIYIVSCCIILYYIILYYIIVYYILFTLFYYIVL